MASFELNDPLDDNFLFSGLPPLNDSDLSLSQFLGPSHQSSSSSSSFDVNSFSIFSNLSSHLRPEHESSSLDTRDNHKSFYPQVFITESDHQIEAVKCSTVDGGVHMSTSEDTNGIAKGHVQKQNRSNKKRIELGKRGERQKIIIQVRSEQVLEDGYRWRKYGEKAMENSSIPRSYYKCSDKKCSVKKRVERKPSDAEILVVMYEGIHNHPCPNPVCYVEKHSSSLTSSVCPSTQHFQNRRSSFNLVSVSIFSRLDLLAPSAQTNVM
eukprot:Gb_40207 [translate_table: standard]